ncbi:MAG: Zn-dependent oligopeptidase [Actinomycetales bacterium]|uniref:Zn-dependent oligopeptidase n=1 Tax=Candidatus Phosphoribacter hodrii TaxID=2953743 RepID=A0A935ILD7_9MICO|nr:Zn-dependent oligopeptidase [Candidatus Phosphoribacter hodrii]
MTAAQASAPLALPTAASAHDWLSDRAATGLAKARSLVADLKAAPPADALATLKAWNDVDQALGSVSSPASLFAEVHPDEAVRERADVAGQEVQKLATELGLDRALFEVFAALDPAGLDADAARFLDKTLRDFRRSGVDRDEPTRERIRAINERLTVLGQEFSKNIRNGVRSIEVTPDRLEGMPQDWLDAHPADERGLVTVTTDYPDVVPLRTFCADAQARRDLTMEFLTVGWPANDALLHELFDLRHELAQLLGYETWADYDAEVKMIKEGGAIPVFIEKIADAALESGVRDREVVLARMRADVPDATAIDSADLAYYANLVSKEQLEVDAQLVRTYLDFTKVRAGLLEVTGRLFGLRYEPAADAVVWDEAVAAYDVYRADGDEPLGRIYLDLHPREGKYKHAAQFDLVTGVAGRQLPEGVLVCNFSRGLMEHDHVVTLFHEFGHLVHHVLAGHQEWFRFSGVATEWDFVEAPSQMLEEWAWDADILQTFATNEAGEPIPADLVRRMRRADDFGKGYLARTQMFYAALSYWFHTERPADLTARTRELQAQYSLFPYIEGTHFTCAFGHLEGYSSAYYTYMWSLVIAKDLFSAFDRSNMFDAEVAGRYRDRVLAPGGSKDAADLVADFLGRPYTFDAYAAWLAE